MAEEFTSANLNKMFKMIKKQVIESIKDEIKSSTILVAGKYKENVRNKRKIRTGDFINSISAVSSDNWFTGEAGADKEFPAKYLEDGTRAHGPVRAKMLHWVENGVDIWAKFVKGITAGNHLGNAYVKIMGGDNFVRRFIRRINGVTFRI